MGKCSDQLIPMVKATAGRVLLPGEPVMTDKGLGYIEEPVPANPHPSQTVRVRLQGGTEYFTLAELVSVYEWPDAKKL